MFRRAQRVFVVYQETATAKICEMHTSPVRKAISNWRLLIAAERGYAAGFRRLGIGALIGLSPWQEEAIALQNVDYLLKRRRNGKSA